MKPSEINEFIAKELGWTYKFEPSDEEMEEARLGTGRYEGAPGYPIGSGPLGGIQEKRWFDADGNSVSSPDFYGDSQAIDTAVAGLVPFYLGQYGAQLGLLIAAKHPNWGLCHVSIQIAYISLATSMEKCEAFLKAHHSWRIFSN